MSAMKNFENVKLPQDKFGLHQTCTVYCGVVALSTVYLVGFLIKNGVRSYYGRTLRLIPAVYGIFARFNRRMIAPHGFVYTGQGVGLVLAMSLVLLVSRVLGNAIGKILCPPLFALRISFGPHSC